MVSDDELAQVIERHPELAGLARMAEGAPTVFRAEAIEAFLQFARVYDGRTLEEREAMLEYAARHAGELAAKAQH